MSEYEEIIKKLSDREKVILSCLAEGPIQDDSTRGFFYRLGGKGTVPVRYNPRTMKVMLNKGLVKFDKGVYNLSQKGSIIFDMCYPKTY